MWKRTKTPHGNTQKSVSFNPCSAMGCCACTVCTQIACKRICGKNNAGGLVSVAFFCRSCRLTHKLSELDVPELQSSRRRSETDTRCFSRIDLSLLSTYY